MVIAKEIDLKKLYEIDDSLWLEKTIELLKEKKYEQLDWDNLIEELESLARRDKQAVASYLELIICHLLYLQFWHDEYERNYHHWEAEIATFRNNLERKLTTNLQNYLEDELDNIYHGSVKIASRKTKNQYHFPSECPYTLEQLLDENWFPIR